MSTQWTIENFDLKSYHEEVWQELAFLPREKSVAIAARAAWRALPTMFQGWPNPAELDEWWHHYADIIAAKLILAACQEQYSSKLVKAAAGTVANVAIIGPGASASAAVSNTASAISAAANAANAVFSFSSPSATSSTAASAVAYAASAIAYESGNEGLFNGRTALEDDISSAKITEVRLSFLPLWQELVPVAWEERWSSTALIAMTKTPGAQMLHAWMVQWVRGQPPIDAMRAWLNDWWLRHPNNTDKTAAYTDLPAELASEPQPLPDPLTEPSSLEAAPPPAQSSTPADPPPPPPEPEEQIIKRYKLESTVSLVSDREAKELTDTANKCKEALARFLASRETQAPLTVSIEAPWGAGKTSFMHHLRRRLEAEKIPTVWFNPWKHEAGKTMWAAFAVAYERQMARHLSRPGLILRRVALTFARMSWAEVGLMILRLVVWSAAGWGLWWLWEHGVKAVSGEGKEVTELLVKGLPWLGGPVLLWKFAKDVAVQFGNPLKMDVVKLFTESHHEDGVDDLHRFHEDFARLMRAYHPANSWGTRVLQWWDEVYASADEHWKEKWHSLRNLVLGRGDDPMPPRPRRYELRRVAVFIDDLDRCEAPKAADVLQSLHLMLNVTESCLSEAGKDKRMPDMICILGMDREKVAAAVAAKHEKLLPLLLEPDAQGKVPRGSAMGFGHEFLEKFIQLTLHLPGIMGKDQEHFLKGITGWKAPEAKAAPKPPPAAPPPVASLPTRVPSNPMHSSKPPDLVATEVALQAARLKKAVEERVRDLDSLQAARVKQEVEKRVREVDEQLHDGQTAYDCALYVADALENNPRRLKQFVNLLRLRLLLAAAMDLLDADTLSAEVTVVKEGKLSAHHLAKLVALDLMCPQSMAKMRVNPGVTFEELQSEVMKEQKERQDVFTNLIKHGHGGRPVNSCWLGTAPLAAYFQQLATVAPAPTADSSV